MPGTAHNLFAFLIYLHDCTWPNHWVHRAILHPDVTVSVTWSDGADQVSERHTAQLPKKKLNIGREVGVKHNQSLDATSGIETIKGTADANAWRTDAFL
jgi:hypothetical protein